MSADENLFQVDGNKFWILEKRGDENLAWVFQKEDDAIEKLEELISDEEISADEFDEEVEQLGEKYNLQEVEIKEGEYKVKAMSWFKLAISALTD